MPRGSVKRAHHEHIASFERHQRRGAFPPHHEEPPPAGFVPRNRNERRALAAYQRQARHNDKGSDNE